MAAGFLAFALVLRRLGYFYTTASFSPGHQAEETVNTTGSMGSVPGMAALVERLLGNQPLEFGVQAVQLGLKNYKYNCPFLGSSGHYPVCH